MELFMTANVFECDDVVGEEGIVTEENEDGRVEEECHYVDLAYG